MSEFPRKDVHVHGYVSGTCPNCGRLRLELYIDGEEERAVGLACEKCGAQWLLDPATASFFGDLSDDNPLKPPADDEDFGLEGD
jgi:predicted RNA-binding Zn-ribbon protein involved in translation (DUF1610 family)